MPSDVSRGRIPALDGLRALACLAVFGVHWQQFTGFAAVYGVFDIKRLLENGNTGVSLFFTLSGLLLSLPFWSGAWGARGRPWLRDYVVGRAVRILPAYYLCVGALVVYHRHFQTTTERWDVLTHALFLQNFWEHTFYALAPPFWTIAVQAQSYVLLPLVMVAIVRVAASRYARAILVAGCAAGSYVLHLMTVTAGAATGMAAWAAVRPTVATHSLLAHAPQFLIGVFGGLFVADLVERSGSEPPVRKVWRELSVWLSAIAIPLILATPLDGRLSLPYGRYNLPVVPLLVLWIILAAPRTRIARAVLDAPPLRWLGTISFGVYVYHYPALEFTKHMMQSAGLSTVTHEFFFAFAALLLTTAFATGSFVILERPILRLAKRAGTVAAAAVDHGPSAHPANT